MFHDLGFPLSLTADARLHTTGDYTLTVGLKGYFGGNDDGKSLINRHRQDDPHNKAVDLFGAAGGQLYATAPTTTTPPPADPEAVCLAQNTDGVPEPDGEAWVWNPGTTSCDLEPVV